VEVQSRNRRVSAERLQPGLRRLAGLKRRIDVLILALGGNDALRGVHCETTRENLDQILTRTRARNLTSSSYRRNAYATIGDQNTSRI